MSKLRSRLGVIYFLSGNNLTIPEEERSLQKYPVRQCTVVDAFHENDVDQITFILQLQEFVSCEIDQARISREDMPPKTFVSEAVLDGIINVTWIQAVRALERHFNDALFCQIACVLKGAKPISARYSKALKHSYFHLKEDSVYAIKCICYDPTAQNRSLVIRYQSEDLEVSNSFESGVGAGTDVRLLPLRTRALKAHSSQIFSTFYSPKASIGGQSADPNQGDPNHFRIWWQVGRKRLNILLFGLCSGLLALAVVLTQAFDKACPPWGVVFVSAGIILAGFAAAGLFNFFNKI
ncbi:MAG: hypothetical protein WA183_11595 [Chthoniobacterales bacterium]